MWRNNFWWWWNLIKIQSFGKSCSWDFHIFKCVKLNLRFSHSILHNCMKLQVMHQLIHANSKHISTLKWKRALSQNHPFKSWVQQFYFLCNQIEITWQKHTNCENLPISTVVVMYITWFKLNYINSMNWSTYFVCSFYIAHIYHLACVYRYETPKWIDKHWTIW